MKNDYSFEKDIRFVSDCLSLPLEKMILELGAAESSFYSVSDGKMPTDDLIESFYSFCLLSFRC